MYQNMDMAVLILDRRRRGAVKITFRIDGAVIGLTRKGGQPLQTISPDYLDPSMVIEI